MMSPQPQQPMMMPNMGQQMPYNQQFGGAGMNMMGGGQRPPGGMAMGGGMGMPMQQNMMSAPMMGKAAL